MIDLAMMDRIFSKSRIETQALSQLETALQLHQPRSTKKIISFNSLHKIANSGTDAANRYGIAGTGRRHLQAQLF
jgi:hypothetical protein